MFVDNIGLTRILHGRTNDPETLVFKKCIDIFHRRAFTDITDENSKLRTYGIFKKEVREEPYLKALIDGSTKKTVDREILNEN